jgi:hypothetical protein
MSDRRLREDVEVRSLFDPDLEIVLKARDSLSDPDRWVQVISSVASSGQSLRSSSCANSFSLARQ